MSENAEGVTVNVNDYVWIRLTDAGRKHHREWHQSRYPMLPYRAPDESAAGWSKWQLWALMKEMGDACVMGMPLPFETSIRLSGPSA